MNPARSRPMDYINFLPAAQKSFTCSEAARCQPKSGEAPAHDAFTRLLRRQPPDTEALWQETRGLVQLEGGVLVLDDTTLDKPYARKMELVPATGAANTAGWCPASTCSRCSGVAAAP